jgi:hypothetical protein
MKTKLTKAITISVFLFSIFVGMQAFEATLANPSLGSYPYSETPDTSPPSIKIQMPEPNKVYDAKTVPYSITIEKPSSWFENDTIHGTLRSVGYVLDEKENVTIADVFIQTSYLPDFQSETRTISLEGNLSGLSEGNHTIQVWVNSVSIYHPSDTPQNFYGWWAAVADYPIKTSSNTTYFSIINLPTEPASPSPAQTAAPTITAIPSTSPSPESTPQNSPTHQPTLAPSPKLDYIQGENYTSTIIILSLATIAVVVGLIVYFKKRRR